MWMTSFFAPTSMPTRRLDSTRRPRRISLSHSASATFGDCRPAHAEASFDDGGPDLQLLDCRSGGRYEARRWLMGLKKQLRKNAWIEDAMI